MKTLVFLATSAFQVTAAVFGFFFLLMALNGHSERHATPGLIFYIAFCLMSTVALCFGGSYVSKALVERKWLGSIAAAIVAIVSASLIGLVLVFTSLFASILFAEFLRRAGS